MDARSYLSKVGLTLDVAAAAGAAVAPTLTALTTRALTLLDAT